MSIKDKWTLEESRIVIVRSAPKGGPPMTLFDKLHRYYEGEGILATQFICEHKAECRGGSPSFTGPEIGVRRRALP